MFVLTEHPALLQSIIDGSGPSLHRGQENEDPQVTEFRRRQLEDEIAELKSDLYHHQRTLDDFVRSENELRRRGQFAAADEERRFIRDLEGIIKSQYDRIEIAERRLARVN